MLAQSVICPTCKVALSDDDTTCPDCGEDLAPIIKLRTAPYILYNQGLQLAASGDLDGAIGKVRESLGALPDEPKTYILLSKLYMQKGDHAQARYWWKKTLECWPQESIARQGLEKIDALEAAEQTKINKHRRGQLGKAILTFGLGGMFVGSIMLISLVGWQPSPASSPSAIPIATNEPTLTPTTLPTLSPTVAPPTPIPTSPPPTITPTKDLVSPMQSAIQADSDLAKLTIKVRQQGNSIFLEGDVPSLWIKYKLEGVAKSIDGVNLVDVSGLRITYSVQKGDTLSQIALDIYGEWTLWKYIAAHNKVLDPYIIYPGQILVIPPPL